MKNFHIQIRYNGYYANFSVIAEEFGFIGSIIILGMYYTFILIGIYIAMNGQIFDQKNVKKNKKMGIFEELDSIK